MAEDKKYYAICEGCKSLVETLSKEQIEKGTANILWTNPKPTEEFAAQTIELKENSYKYFRIKFRNLSNDRVWFFDVEANTSFQVIMNALYTPSGKGYLGFFYRSDCSCTQKTITFDTGKYISGADTSINDRNNYLIPVEVIGFNL